MGRESKSLKTIALKDYGYKEYKNTTIAIPKVICLLSEKGVIYKKHMKKHKKSLSNNDDGIFHTILSQSLVKIFKILSYIFTVDLIIEKKNLLYLRSNHSSMK